MKIILKTFVLFCLFPLCVNALNVSTSISCPNSSLKVNEEETCSLYVNTDSLIYGFSGIIKTSNELSVLAINSSSNWQGSNNGTNKFDLYSSGVSGKILIGTIKIKLNQSANGTIIFENIVVSDSNFNDFSANGTTTTISVKHLSDNNNLASLSIQNCQFNQVFSKNITDYTCNTNDSSVNVSASLEDTKASLSGIGTKVLNEGSNIIKVIVVSESNITKTYTINVIRNKIVKNEISTTKNDNKNSVINNDKPVVPSNNNTKIEENIVTEESKICNATLNKLQINNIDILKDNKFDYYYSFYSDSNFLELLANSDCSDAQINISGNDDLHNGFNNIKIEVTTGVESKSYNILVFKSNGYKKVDSLNHIDSNSYFETTTLKEISKDIMMNLDKNFLIYSLVNEDNKLIFSLTMKDDVLYNEDYLPNIIKESNDSYKLNILKNTIVTLNIGNENLGKYVYIYNETGEYITRTLNEYGYINFIADGSSKIILKNSYIENKKKVSTNTKEEKSYLSVWIVSILSFLAVVGCIILLAIKYRRAKNEKK